MYLVAAVSFNNDILNTTNVSLTSLHPETHSIDSSIKRRNSTMKSLHSKETEAKKITKIPRQIIKEHRWHSTSLMYAIFHILTVVWHNVSPLMVVFWDHRVVAIVRARNKKKRRKKKEKKARRYKRKKKRRKAKGTVSSQRYLERRNSTIVMNRRTMRAGYRVREIIASGTRTNWPGDIYKLHFALARPFVFSDGRAARRFCYLLTTMAP